MMDCNVRDTGLFVSTCLLSLLTGCFASGDAEDRDDEMEASGTEEGGDSSDSADPHTDGSSDDGDDGDDDTPPPEESTGESESEHTHVQIEASTLDTMSGGFHYEGWGLIDGAPVSTGKFNVDASGAVTDLDGIAIPDGVFDAGRDLSVATEFIITIESPGDVDITPAETHYLGGVLEGVDASLTVDGGTLAFATDFTDAVGHYILATPTDGPESNETSGAWWIDLSVQPPQPGLEIPELPPGWEYEGWVVIDGMPVSTGRFLYADAPDFSDEFSGPQGGPPFPGEDLLVDAPEGLDFPAEIRGRNVVVTVEPQPDDSPTPFTLKPLAAEVPEDAATMHSFEMINQAEGFPSVELHLLP